jgi:alkylation response protein AidB-like acyl-CoA dehydrogenase
MNSEKISHKTGGGFLIESIGKYPIFTREQFSDEHCEIEKMVKEFARERVLENKEEIEKFNKELSLSLIREIGELGLLGVDIPEEYGGMDLDKITSAIVAESLMAGSSASFIVTWSVQTGIGSLPIVWFGTPEQKEKYLPKLVTGEWIGAYGLTEPSAGSDALSGKTSAVLSDNGKYYILNGEKIFISNGGWGQVYIVFAQIEGDKFSAFIVDRDTPGFGVGAEEKKMGMKGSSTTSLTFTDAKVPVENLLYKIGKGATIAFNTLNMGRLKLAASDLGGAKIITAGAIRYGLERKQFGQAITNFDVIKGKIADMVIRTYATDSMIYRTIGLVQNEIDLLDKSDPDYYIHMGEAMERYAIEASMAKVYGSETTALCADNGVQILGGYGFIEEYPMAGAYRDARIDRIWEGTNEINRQIITGYFMKKALMEELPIRDAIQEIDTFLSNYQEPDSDQLLSREAQAIECGKRLALFLFHEALCRFGQDLKHEQQLTEILANMFIEIYTAESTIARVQQTKESNALDQTSVSVAKVYSAEVCLKLLNFALTGLNGIYRAHLPESIIDHLRKFQINLLLPTDVIGLKRTVAEKAYAMKDYPF